MFADRRFQSASLVIVLIVYGMAITVSSAHAVKTPSSSSSGQGSQSMNGLIAFLDRTDHGSETSVDLYTMSPQGDRTRNLSDGAFHQGAPAWSPDGRYLLYWSNNNIVRRAPGGRIRLLIAPEVSGDVVRKPWEPEISPDGTRLVYCMKPLANDASEGEIVVSRSDGSDARTVLDVPGLTCDQPPSWSPDGRFLTFPRLTPAATTDVTSSHVWIMEADGDRPRDLTPLSVNGAYGPSFLRDGRILFQAFQDCATEPFPCGDIYTMDPDGGDVRRLTFGTDHPGIDYMHAEASPDERQLVVVYRTTYQPPQSQRFGLLLHDLETASTRRLVDYEEAGYRTVDWQPRCTVRGTQADDVLIGTPERDLICGLGGDDVLRGRGGDDVLFGHRGNDRVTGGAGHDIVVGNSGRDRCDSDQEDLSRVC